MKLLTLMMNFRQVFSFVKNVLIFLIDRLYKEWEYMLGRGQSNYNEEAFRRGDLFAKQLMGNKFGKNDSYEMKGKRRFSCGIASVVFGKALLTGFNSLHQTNKCSYTEERNRLFINITIERGPLTYQRQIVYKLGNFVRKAAIIISLTDINVSSDFSAEKETGRNGFLLNFAVNKLNGFKLSVSGFGYFDWAINLFLSFWRPILERIFRNLLEWKLQQFAFSILPNLKFPVEAISYRNETELTDKRVQNNEESLSESYDVKQSTEKPKWPMSPIFKSSACDGHNSEEYGAEENLGSNLNIANISRCFPETNKWISERNNFDLQLQRYPSSETLNKIYPNEVSENEDADRLNLVSKLSTKTRELTKSFEMMEKKLDLINNITKSLSKDSALKNCLEILDADKRNMNSASSLTAKGLKNEEQFVIRERKEGKFEVEDFSNKLRDSYREFEIASVKNENFGQSELHEGIFSKIQDPSNKGVDGNSFNTVIKTSTRVANCESSPSTKLESSQIHKNILKPSTTDTGLFIKPVMDYERRKAQIDHLENMFNGKKRKERTKDSNKNPFSVESFNHFQSLEGTCLAWNPGLKLDSTEIFQDEFKVEKAISCAVREFEKHLKAVERQIEDPEPENSYFTERNRSVKSPEIQYISNPKGEVDGRNFLNSNATSNSMLQQIIKDEKSFNTEVDSKMVSTSLQFNEELEHKVNEKMPIEYVKVHTEEELNEDSQLKADEGCSVADSLCVDSSLLHPVLAPFPTVSVGFPAQSLDLRSKSLPNKSFKEPTKVGFELKIDQFSVNSCNTSEISRLSKIGEESDSINYITNDLSEKISVIEEMMHLNEGYDESTDSGTEISNITRLNKLHGKISVGTRKMLSNMALESDSEDDAYSSCKNLERTKNIDPKNKSLSNELNQFQRKDSKSDLGVVSLVEDGNTLSSVKEFSTFKYENLSEFEFSSESDTETSSETENELKHEM